MKKSVNPEDVLSNPFHNVSLTKQLLYLIAVTLIVVLVSLAVSIPIAQRTVERKVSESANNIVFQVEETLTSFFDDMDGITYSLLYSPVLQNFLSTVDSRRQRKVEKLMGPSRES